jgi:hypothetical protein
MGFVFCGIFLLPVSQIVYFLLYMVEPRQYGLKKEPFPKYQLIIDHN